MHIVEPLKPEKRQRHGDDGAPGEIAESDILAQGQPDQERGDSGEIAAARAPSSQRCARRADVKR